MLLFLDKQTGSLVMSEGGEPIQRLNGVIGSVLPVQLGFLENHQVVSLPFSDRAIRLGVRTKGGTLIALAETWVWDATSSRYLGYLDLNTVEALDAIDEEDEIECHLQVIWKAAGQGPYGSNVALIRLEQPAVNFEDGSPSTLPDPEDWMNTFLADWFQDRPTLPALDESDYVYVGDASDSGIVKKSLISAFVAWIVERVNNGFLRIDGPQATTPEEKEQGLLNLGAAASTHTHSIGDVTNLQEILVDLAADLEYLEGDVDTLSDFVGTKLSLTGGTMSGPITLSTSTGALASNLGTPGLIVTGGPDISDDSWISFHLPYSDLSARLGVLADGTLSYGGGAFGEESYRVYHSGNYLTMPVVNGTNQGMMSSAMLTLLNNAVPNSRTVAGKALTSNITLNTSDIQNFATGVTNALLTSATGTSADDTHSVQMLTSLGIYRLGFGSFRASLRTTLDNVYMMLTGAQTVAGQKIFSSSPRSTGLADDATSLMTKAQVEAITNAKQDQNVAFLTDTTTAYSLQPTAAGKTLLKSNAAAQTITVQSGAWTAGNVVTIINTGAGVVSFAAGSGVTLANSAITLNEHGIAQILCVTSTTFRVL